MKKIILGLSVIVAFSVPVLASAQVSQSDINSLQKQITDLKATIAALTIQVNKLSGQKVIPEANPSAYAIVSPSGKISQASPEPISMKSVASGQDIYVTLSGPSVKNTDDVKVQIAIYIRDQASGSSCNLANYSNSPATVAFNTAGCTQIPISYYSTSGVTFRIPSYKGGLSAYDTSTDSQGKAYHSYTFAISGLGNALVTIPVI